MKIRTLVIDDAVIYRKIAMNVLSTFPDIELIGTAATGEIALKKMLLNPVDLVFCDIHMPGMDGVQTLAEIRKLHPDTLVVMISGVSSRSAETTVKALEGGALDFIRKPDGPSTQENETQLRRDVENVLRMTRIRLGIRPSSSATLSRTQKPSPPVPPSPTRLPAVPDRFGVVAIGVSTGGPEALTRLIPSLPSSIPVPIVVVQHMPPNFTRSLAESLNKRSALTVVEAEHEQSISPGTVYIAPGGRHMTIRKQGTSLTAALNDSPPENSCRPSVDVLFRSVATVWGDAGILGVVLTGMGSDGAKGMQVMKRKGCYCITQSESSCVVYGMPRAVDELKLSDISLPVENIGPEICKRLRCK